MVIFVRNYGYWLLKILNFYDYWSVIEGGENTKYSHGVIKKKTSSRYLGDLGGWSGSITLIELRNSFLTTLKIGLRSLHGLDLFCRKIFVRF